MNHRIAVSILTSFPNFGERFYSKKLRQPLPARGPEDEPRIFQTPSIERGSFRALTNQNNTEGAPGSSFEPGSWGCLSLFTLPRRSNEEAFAHWQIKTTGGCPRFVVGTWVLGLLFSSYSSTSIATSPAAPPW